jgi:hypothetical protein
MSDATTQTTTQKVVKLLTEQEIKNSMADARFYEQMPEFLPLRKKMQAMHSDLVTPRGCSSCAKNRVYRNMGGDYLRLVAGLKGDAADRLRRYFGADELRATVLDPATRKPKTISI